MRESNSAMIFVTLFNSYYIDKGIVLFESMRKCMDDFKLYVIAFDDQCNEILESCFEDQRLIVVSLGEFEDETLLKAKKDRSFREYCWTCSSYSIKYVIETFCEPICTYIDADMFFYSSPQPLFDELQESQSDVGIMEHGFLPCKENERYIKNSGKYCVEFNTFRNNENGKKVLDWWCNQCLADCSEKMDGVHFGDQKYVEEFAKKFIGVHVYENQGAGVAPWNIARFTLAKKEPLLIVDKKTKNAFRLIFYHFQNILFLSNNEVSVEIAMYPRKAERKLIHFLYYPYLYSISKSREKLNKSGIDMAQLTRYVEKVRLRDEIEYLINNERNVGIILKRLFRMIFRKKYDYLKWGEGNEKVS